jgi:hypothetical protein
LRLTLSRRYLTAPLFVGCAILYWLNRIGIHERLVHNWFLREHFNDLLTVPVMIPLMVLVQQLMGSRPDSQVVTGREILGWTAAWSVLFEGLAPLVGFGTADLLDVMAYFAGALVLIWSQNHFLLLTSSANSSKVRHGS